MPAMMPATCSCCHGQVRCGSPCVCRQHQCVRQIPPVKSREPRSWPGTVQGPAIAWPANLRTATMPLLAGVYVGTSKGMPLGAWPCPCGRCGQHDGPNSIYQPLPSPLAPREALPSHSHASPALPTWTGTSFAGFTLAQASVPKTPTTPQAQASGPRVGGPLVKHHS